MSQQTPQSTKPKRKRSKKEEEPSHLTSTAVINGDTFRRVFLNLQLVEEDPELALKEEDIDVSSAQRIPAFQQIETAIEADVTRIVPLLTGDVASNSRRIIEDLTQVPTIQEIEDANQADLECIKNKTKVPTEKKPKKAKKLINYITNTRHHFMTETEAPKDFQQIHDNEVVITVSIYHPRKKAKMEEFLVLGSQRLTDLRDRIYCISNHIFDGETTVSGCFLFENVIFDDMRVKEHMRIVEDENTGVKTEEHMVLQPIPYSNYLINWLNGHKRSDLDRTYVARIMSDFTFKEIGLRIGCPYLYLHQGNCEHSIIFTEMRFRLSS
eukprot:TRINITY_DN5051_c0_g1_i1.p1 TRINITY_DN5051_c0_g1~~TRINITY_DN5051_c0_g1_i1.p1  ORF type:complete len:325 (-),score=42.80 TRINITY_DN5051_c0_g1_i1:331-1305(-)